MDSQGCSCLGVVLHDRTVAHPQLVVVELELLARAGPELHGVTCVELACEDAELRIGPSLGLVVRDNPNLHLDHLQPVPWTLARSPGACYAAPRRTPGWVTKSLPHLTSQPVRTPGR